MNAEMVKELRARRLIALIEAENQAAARETQHSDGWMYDHAQVIHDYDVELQTILNSLKEDV